MWSQLQRIIHLRAIEETDRKHLSWPADRARQATQITRQQFPKASAPQFLLERSKHFSGEIGLPKLPGFPAWFLLLILIIDFFLGWSLAALGQESEINLLALPLVGLLLWNVVVMIMSLVSAPHQTAWLQPLKGFLLRSLQSDKWSQPSTSRFMELAQTPWLQFLNGRFRAWLHLAAAILALGSITGMYARGWSKEYRAVWESTLLSESSATTFFSTFFLPASSVLQLPIPSDQIPSMRRGVTQPAAEPAPALPWIHLYAGTLFLFILLPRMALVMLELHRTRQLFNFTLKSPEWQNYTGRLLALTDSTGATVQVLIHAQPLDQEAQDQWRIYARQCWPDMGSVSFLTIPAGTEASFIDTWAPKTDQPLLLIFNLASVPEIEVHRWLVESILKKWMTVKPHPILNLILDESALHRRWSGFADYAERLEQRRATWLQILQNLPVQILNAPST